MKILFTKFRKIYYIFSGVLCIASIAAIIMFGLKPGIEFTGGTIMEIEYQDLRPQNQEVFDKIKDLNLGNVYLQPTGDKSLIFRLKNIEEDIHQQILTKLREGDIKIEEKRYESIGPTIGRELKKKTNIVILLALLAMLIYITLAFRRVQRPVKSWQYGLASLIALFHDIFIPLGVFAVLGKYYGVEISIPVITALLMVLGYSINNTVVVFDRIRENLLKRGGTFEEIVDSSLNQTLTRQINTSLTTLFTSGSIFIFGGESIKYFALVISLGIIAGLYSSIFIASPLLLSWMGWRKKV